MTNAIGRLSARLHQKSPSERPAAIAPVRSGGRRALGPSSTAFFHDLARAQELARSIDWYAATATVALWGLLSPRRQLSAYRIQKLRRRSPSCSMGAADRFLSWRAAQSRLVPGGLRCAARALASRAGSTRSWPSACRSLMPRPMRQLLEHSASVGKLVPCCQPLSRMPARTLADGPRRAHRATHEASRGPNAVNVRSLASG